MMQATAEEVKLNCPECRRENEAERVYCHDCGARLDRSALAKVKATEEDPKETQRRLKQLLDPQRAQMRQRFFMACKLILAASLVAGLVQMFRAPEVPPHTKPALAELPPQINFDLENATTSAQPTTLSYTEEQVNAYVTGALRSKQTSLSKYLKFERLLLGFDEGVVRLTVERSLYGYSIYSGAIYSVSLQDGKVVLKNLGGQIGRLQFHPQLTHFSDILFADVAAALAREHRLVGKLGGLEIHPKQVVFVSK